MYRMMFLLALIVLDPSLTLAQNRPRSASWYEENDRGNRFEGYYSEPVSVGPIKLLSLVGYAPRYEFGEDQELFLHFFLPESGRYWMKAEELKKGKYYWCESRETDARSGWAMFGPWPVDDRLDDGPVTDRNLGVLVHLGDPDLNRFAPVFASQTSSPQKSGYYVARLAIGRNVESGRFTVHQGEQAVGSRMVYEKSLRGGSGGIAIAVVIPTAKLTSEGWYTVEVELTKENAQGPISESFTFYHHGN